MPKRSASPVEPQVGHLPKEGASAINASPWIAAMPGTPASALTDDSRAPRGLKRSAVVTSEQAMIEFVETWGFTLLAPRTNLELQQMLLPLLSSSTWLHAIEAVQRGEDRLPTVEREASILFTDIAGFTSMAERHGWSRVLAELDVYFDLIGQIIRSEGGDIDKFTGDGLMAVFGSADGAIRAGKRILRAISDSSADRAAPKLSFLTRIGVDTGTVITTNIGTRGRQDRTTMGSAVNLASRLEEMATPGTLLISHTTYSRLREQDGLDKRDPVQIKGYPGPMLVYEWKEDLSEPEPVLDHVAAS